MRNSVTQKRYNSFIYEVLKRNILEVHVRALKENAGWTQKTTLERWIDTHKALRQIIIRLLYSGIISYVEIRSLNLDEPMSNNYWKVEIR